MYHLYRHLYAKRAIHHDERTYKKAASEIAKQVQECNLILQKFFKKFPDECWKADDIGCCGADYVYPNNRVVTDGIFGIAKKEILHNIEQQWKKTVHCKKAHCSEHHIPPDTESAFNEYNIDKVGDACMFHGEQGCTLGKYKPPMCAAHYCHGPLDELIENKRFTRKIQKYYNRVLEGHFNERTQQYEHKKNKDVIKELKQFLKDVEKGKYIDG